MHTELTTLITYPTMAGVIAASATQLEYWAATLPRPNSDVERSIRARIDRRLALLNGQAKLDPHAERETPRVEDSVAQLRLLMGLLGDPSTFDRGFSVH